MCTWALLAVQVTVSQVGGGLFVANLAQLCKGANNFFLNAMPEKELSSRRIGAPAVELMKKRLDF